MLCGNGDGPDCLTLDTAFVRRIFIQDLIDYFRPAGRGRSVLPGQFMDKLYFGLGAALYLLFVVWCIGTPQK
jgi:hypothetical protein